MTAEPNALTSAGLCHLTAELGSPPRPTLMGFLKFCFQHRGKPLLRGLWLWPRQVYLVFPLMSQFLSQAAALYLRSDSFQGWFAFHNGSVRPLLLLPSQTRLGCAAVQTQEVIRRFPECLRKAPGQRLGCVMGGELRQARCSAMCSQWCLTERSSGSEGSADCLCDGKCCGILLVRVLVLLHHFPSLIT